MIYITGLNKTISDISIILFGLLILSFLYDKKIITKRNFIVFVFFLLITLLFNNVLIDPFRLWDQFAYANRVSEINDLFSRNINLHSRNNLKEIIIRNELQVYFFSFIHSLFFFLYKESINSIALINKILLILSLILVNYKKKLNDTDIYILLLLPSTIFYSSLSLKETFLFALCVFAIYCFSERKVFSLLFIVTLTLLLRFEFGIYLLANIIIIFLLQNTNKNNIFIFYSLSILVLFSIFYIFEISILEKLNFYKYNFNIENSGWHVLRTPEIIGGKFSLNIFDIQNFFSNISFSTNKLIFIKDVYKIFFIIELIFIIFLFTKVLISNSSNRFKNLNTIIVLVIVFLIFCLIPNIFLMHRYIYNFVIFYFIMSRYKFNSI